ncbi:TPA: hypothetical protein ACK8Z3_000382 [Legionella pneumophila]|uniref:hypothetical protein n=1 Tax=Legionella pneumophila TaxID=446 RepID=UPI000044513A|nr:hypothetical protein [Legionella pneumophila]ERH43190.1 hypothetical protein N751_01450 [Legionella pneumophila str. Leg01/11]ERH44520.1 hypothetical protein N750_08625 [Legionella pneumophila str. Leg01/53]ERI48423.1 hypothetical protein N749_09360 [Legionella pneumophila str. Leg01/20]ERB40307.1 hypothetical protein N748_14645 [Legionella pneumophila str. 121004]MCW8405776.1 hypothetical protein [Legionella pneumophila]
MRKAYVSVNGIKAGILEELQSGKYQFSYIDDYHESVQGQILPFASILKNYKSYKSQWEQRARSDPSPNPNTILSPNIP